MSNVKCDTHVNFTKWCSSCMEELAEFILITKEGKKE